MLIAGANLGNTRRGMKLNDGGLCIIDTDSKKIIAMAEERITRKKYDGGFKASLEKYLDLYKKKINDIDLFVISSCCEEPIKEVDNIVEGLATEKIKVIPSHHLSHAYSTYFSSNFDEALIIVLDNEGNIIGKEESEKFYENNLEHMSYYIAKGNKIELLERDEVKKGGIGVGDAYRYFTHYIGFPSYVYAGKTMGLAPYGNEKTFKNVKIFDLVDGHIICHIPANYFNPCESLRTFFKEKYNINLPKERTPIDEISQVYADLAFLIQKETEDILIKKINYLIKKTGIHNICIAGGVGLNSVANGKILKECNVNNLYIVPAAGDSGECLGNAYYGYYTLLKNKKRIAFDNSYLGFEYSKADLKKVIDKLDKQQLIINKFNSIDKLNNLVAKKLSEGLIISRCSGRSEFGPRALGNRSILMDPRRKENKDILNARVKFRESFRPFAPIILRKNASEYFNMDIDSKYMLMVFDVKKPNVIPAVTHVDNSARVQTLSKKDNPGLYNLLEHFYKISGVPVLLNTSFNIAGEPIVETYEDAVNCFLKTNIDGMILENYYIEKKKCDKMEYEGDVT